MLLLVTSLIAGILTILAPCVLPLLPVIVGGSISGATKSVDVKKVFTIVISLGVSVILFTLLLKASTLFIVIPDLFWRWISGGVVILLGWFTLFPKYWRGNTLVSINVASNKSLGEAIEKNSFPGNILTGAALGPVFSTCSPTYFVVLATVLPASPALGLLYLFAYTAGLCLSLFLIAFVGQKIVSKLGMVANPHSTLKRVIGVIFIAVGVAIITGWDKKLERDIIDYGIFDITTVEQQLLDMGADPNSSKR